MASMKTNKKKKTTKAKRVLVWVEGGIAYAKMDKGVEWELIDWDNIKDGSGPWTNEQIDNLKKWGKGLVSPDFIKRLREYSFHSGDCIDCHRSSEKLNRDGVCKRCQNRRDSF